MESVRLYKEMISALSPSMSLYCQELAEPPAASPWKPGHVGLPNQKSQHRQRLASPGHVLTALTSQEDPPLVCVENISVVGEQEEICSQHN